MAPCVRDLAEATQRMCAFVVVAEPSVRGSQGPGEPPSGNRLAGRGCLGSNDNFRLLPLNSGFHATELCWSALCQLTKQVAAYELPELVFVLCSYRLQQVEASDIWCIGATVHKGTRDKFSTDNIHRQLFCGNLKCPKCAMPPRRKIARSVGPLLACSREHLHAQ
eukprot:5947985-Amphidinium_carterae.1